jgi:succinate dehydrogenase / fumarate reductase, flavoprotein subunit
MGGIPTNYRCEVVRPTPENPDQVVPGLMAIGEAACVSVHGANRLGSNSLLDLVVFGRRAGLSAAADAAGTDLAPIPEEPVRDTLAMLDGLLTRETGDNAADIRKELQDNMFDLAFVVRSETSLTKMQEILGGLKERYARVAIGDKGAVYNTDLMETVELGFLLDCAETLVAGALVRTESRGAHFREDHPLRDDANWLKHTLVTRKEDGSLEMDYKPVKMGPYIPMERKY